MLSNSRLGCAAANLYSMCIVVLMRKHIEKLLKNPERWKEVSFSYVLGEKFLL